MSETSREDGGNPAAGAAVTLREITKDGLWPILELKVHPHQEKYVATNAISIAQAHFSPEAWFRAVYADETPVGFAMLHDEPDADHVHLWRFMIGADHQGPGFGQRAIELLPEHARARPGTQRFKLSYNEGEHEPRGFYEKLGFAATGEIDQGEIVMALEL